MKKALFVLFGCILISSCANRGIGASFRYKGSVVTRCAECISGENGFFVAFKKPVDRAKKESIQNGRVGKGVATFRQYDKYTLYVSISRAYREKPVLKKIVKFVKKEQK